MNEFTSEQERAGADYKFCYYCQHFYGDDECGNCTYFEGDD